MKKSNVNILIEGQAGHGPNAVSKIVASVLGKWGYYVFLSREYGSFVRGGYNCNLLTISGEMVMSNENKVNVVVSLDKNLDRSTKYGLAKGAIEIKNEGHENMYFAGLIVKMLGIDFTLLERELKTLHNFDTNLKAAKEGYAKGKTVFKLGRLNREFSMIDGAHAAANGAVASGLDTYIFYPMTPATTIVNYLAENQLEKNIMIFEMEDEISVMNAALGSAITGAKSMVGSSGGGFDLMTEALSLSGIADIPIVVYLSQRPGPATGMATYTAQGDMNLARHAGHGEFVRMVLAPGDPIEAQELMSQAFYFTQKYKIPAIFLTDKHLAESVYTISSSPNLVKSEKLVSFGRYNSYEHTPDAKAIATDEAHIIIKNVEARLGKLKNIEKETEKLLTYKVYGNKNSKNVVLFWGSTKGAVLDSIADLDVKAIQPLFIEPLSKKIKLELQNAKKIIVVENNASSPLSSLIAEKLGIFIEDKNKILRYDGRPFLSDELAEEIKRRIK